MVSSNFYDLWPPATQDSIQEKLVLWSFFRSLLFALVERPAPGTSEPCSRGSNLGASEQQGGSVRCTEYLGLQSLLGNLGLPPDGDPVLPDYPDQDVWQQGDHQDQEGKQPDRGAEGSMQCNERSPSTIWWWQQHLEKTW